MTNENAKTALKIPEKRLRRKLPLIFFQNKTTVNFLKFFTLIASMEWINFL